MAEMLGCTVEELARARLWEFIDDEDLEAARQYMAARARGVGEVHDFKLRRKDGTAVWVSMAASPFTFEDGNKGALAMVRDGTVERRMATELRESNERLELALAVGEMGTWEWTLGTGETHGSRQVREILGLPPGTSLDSNEMFLRHVHPDDIAELEAAMQAHLASGSTERFTNNFRIIRPDGTVRWVRSAGRLIITSSGQRRILGTIVDLTEGRALAEQLQQAHQLESIGRLAGGVAHDFNNLLTAILASVSFAEPGAPPALLEELHTIKTAAERGAELTRQLLAFARKQVI